MELGKRKLKILQAIIEDFILTAEPVGSRTLMKKHDLGISAATIRNEMSDLEELGYLKQPHTSAGRIPSDKGYRLYVDSLMMMNTLKQKQRDVIGESFLKGIGEFEHLITNTSKILSQMTRLTSVVLSPQFEQSKLKHIQLIPIDETTMVLVIVSEDGIVKNAMLRKSKDCTVERLSVITKILNQNLKGLTIRDITNNIVGSLKNEIKMYGSIVDSVIPAIMSTLRDMISTQIYLDGIKNIFDLPEYHSIDKARGFMEMIDRHEYIMELLANSKDGLDIIIGKENKRKEMKDCSLITATYRVNGLLVGKIGVIGPTRMNYEHIVSVVDYVTKKLTESLNDV